MTYLQTTAANWRKHLEQATVKLTERKAATKMNEGPEQQNMNFGAKPESGEELKKLVEQEIVTEILPFNIFIFRQLRVWSGGMWLIK